MSKKSSKQEKKIRKGSKISPLHEKKDDNSMLKLEDTDIEKF